MSQMKLSTLQSADKNNTLVYEIPTENFLAFALKENKYWDFVFRTHMVLFDSYDTRFTSYQYKASSCHVI